MKLEEILCYFGLWHQNTLGQSVSRIFYFWLVWLIKLNTGGALLHCTCLSSIIVGVKSEVLNAVAILLDSTVNRSRVEWEEPYWKSEKMSHFSGDQQANGLEINNRDGFSMIWEASLPVHIEKISQCQGFKN